MSKGRKFVLMTLALADNTWEKLVTGNDFRNCERQSGLARRYSNPSEDPGQRADGKTLYGCSTIR